MFYSANGDIIEKMTEDSIYDSIDQSRTDAIQLNCSNLESELELYFNQYNDKQNEKADAELSINRIKNELEIAVSSKDNIISNINSIVENYNEILLKLINLKCS